MGYINRWSDTIWIAGVPYAPGALIPATSDPAQLRYFEAHGVVEPTTAPVPLSDPLRRVSSQAEEEVTDARDGTE